MVVRSGRTGALLLAVTTLAVVAVAAAVILARRPSLDREWDEDVRVLADVAFGDDGSIALSGIRDWTYASDSITSKAYFDARLDPADIRGLWLYEQELGLGGAIAHTFLVFEFDEAYGPARWLGLSVETRREVGETYSILRGMLRDFELTHVWATERDLVRRRVEYLDYPLTRHRVDVPAEYLSGIFRAFVRTTEALATTPKWYHTVATNCTSSLIEYVNKSEPGAIPPHYSSVLTGRADDHLRDLGYLDPEYRLKIDRRFLAAHPLR